MDVSLLVRVYQMPVLTDITINGEDQSYLMTMANVGIVLSN
jgi:hypothetical protein